MEPIASPGDSETSRMGKQLILHYSIMGSTISFAVITASLFVFWLAYFAPQLPTNPSAALATPLLLVLAGLYTTYEHWRRPLREAKFYEDQFEVAGWGVRKKGSYNEVEGFTRVRTLTGDFRTDSSVFFTVRGVDVTLKIPNRRNRAEKIDIYTLLLQKAPNKVDK